MKKILGIIILLTGFTYGQPYNPIGALQDTTTQLRADIEWIIDTTQALRTDFNNLTDYGDSVTALRASIIENQDSITDLSARSLASQDSVTELRTDITANQDSITNLRTSINSISTGTDISTGGTISSNSLKLNDNIQLKLGTGTEDELLIYYDGSNGYIYQEDNNLTLRTLGDNLYFGTGPSLDWYINSSGNLVPYAAGKDLGSTTTPADSAFIDDLSVTNTIKIGDANINQTELEILDGATVTTNELNILDGVTVTYDKINYLDGATSNLQDQMDTKAPLASPTFTGSITIGSAGISETELEILDGATVTTSELNILDGVTSTATELNKLDGVTATTAEINYIAGTTSNLQTQMDSKLNKADFVDSLKAYPEFFSVPINYPSSSENIALFLCPFDIQIQTVNAAIAGSGTSASINLVWGTSRNAAEDSLFATPRNVTSKSGESLTAYLAGTGNIDMNEWVWFTVSGTDGTITDLTATFTYIRR